MNGRPLRVLLVEDSPDDATLLLLELRRGGFDVTSIRVDTADATAAALAQAEWDLVIADFSMLSAERCAKIALRTMRRGRRMVVTGFINKLSAWGVRLVPRWFSAWMAYRVLGKPRPGELPSRSVAA